MTALPRNRWTAVLAAAVAAIAVALLGGLFTDLGPWYKGLHKPFWQPPDWAFGPAWTVIFGTTAAAGYVAWMSYPTPRQWARIVALFAINAILNILWSALFFHLHRPDWAMVEVVGMWLSIVALIVVLAPVSRTASWLMVPYLVWVTFAGVLNLVVARLNGPFT